MQVTVTLRGAAKLQKNFAACSFWDIQPSDTENLKLQ